MTNLHFANGSTVYVRAAYHSADAARGISADVLLVDEFQDMAAGDLPVLQETMSHSERGSTILTGTPKTVDNHLEAMFNLSTANEWLVPCPKCRKQVMLDASCLGPRGLVCPGCQTAIDPKQGTWVPRNPQATWGDGFWICHPMVPWLKYHEILDRQRTYDPARFKNECLGLPTVLGDHIVTRAEMEACCGQRPMAKTLADIPHEGRDWLIAGLDWGAGGFANTVLVIGYMRQDFKFQICRLERFVGREEPNRILAEIADRCAAFQIKFIAADANGNGSVYNRLLLDRLNMPHRLVGILYSAANQEPYQEGILWKWSVNRSAVIGALFTRVKKQTILFPRIEDSRSFLEEFSCEVAEYDEYNHSIRYTHPETQRDDALHATNYALLFADYSFQRRELMF